MKRTVLIAGGIIVVLLGVLLIAPGFVDWNKYKPRIVAQLEAATGHVYDIEGPLQLSILPAPHVVIGSLSIKAPQDQGGATLLTLDRASVSVELLPLIQGQVHISSVTLDKPVFSASIAKDGTPSWMTPKLKAGQGGASSASAGQPASSMGDNIVLQSVTIRDGAVGYKDERSGAVYAANDINLTLRGDSLFGPFTADGSLVYNGEKIDLQGKAGRIGHDADNTPVQLKADLASGKSHVEFSGVAGLKAPYEIQGETKLATENLADLLKAFVKSPPAGLDKPAQANGVLTFSQNEIAFRNARLGYDGVALNGSVALSGLTKSPMTVAVDLSADDPVDLDKLMPHGAGREAQSENSIADTGAEQNSPVATASLLPKTLTLPAPLSGKVVLGLKAVTFKNLTLNDLSMAVDLSPGNFGGQVKSGVTGKGNLAGTFTLAYAGSAKDAKTGAVTLSKPSLDYRIKLDSGDAGKMAAAFMPEDQLKKTGNLLSGKIALDVKGTVLPSAVKVEAGSLDMLGSPVAFSGSWTPKASKGRDAIALTVSTDQFNVDDLMKQLVPDMGQEAAQSSTEEQSAPAKKTDVAAVARTISLPFDLDLGATVKALHYSGNDYNNVSVKGRLAGDSLTLQNAGFQDEKGNTLNVTGTVASLKDLGGIDISLNGKTPDASLLLKTLKVNASGLPENAGSAEAVAEFKGQADKLGFTANVKALRGSLEASGAMADLLKNPSFSDLTFRLQHPDYVALVKMFDPSFKASVEVTKNLDLFTSMQRDGKVYTFKDIKATVGPATMNGEVKADMGASVPSVTAALQFTTLPIDKLLGAEATVPHAGAIQPESAQQNSGSHARWSRDAINTDWMRKWNADIKTTAGNVSYGNWQVSNAAMDFTLKDGVLTLSKLKGGMYGGQIDMTGKMASSSQAPLDVSASIGMTNVALESFVQSFSGSRLIKAQGTISVASEIKAAGLSPAALISDLSGKGTVNGSNLQFQGFDLARLSQTLAQPSSSIGTNFSNVLGAATSGGTTKFDKLDGAFTVTGGVINFDKMELTGDATVDTAGTINLPLWTVDLTSTITLPATAGAKTAPPPLKVAFKGPLDNPAQTFGKGALESYFMQQIGGNLKNQLLQKAGGKNNALGAILPGLLGTGAAQPQQAAGQAAPAQQAQPQQMKPKDAFKNLLGVIQGQ